MKRWYSELKIKSKKVNEIKEMLFSTYDFDDMYEDEEEKNKIFNIENDILTFEGEEGFNFTIKNTYKIPDIKDLFVTICRKFPKEKLEAKAILVNSIDSSCVKYKVLYKDYKLSIIENDKIIDEANLMKVEENKVIKDEDNKSLLDYFINKIKVYNLPCLPSVFIIEFSDSKYFLDVYYDMGFLNITLRDTKECKEIIYIKDDFEEEQTFTKEIASNEFKKLDNELKKLKMDIINMRFATEDEECEYYSLMANLLYPEEKND